MEGITDEEKILREKQKKKQEMAQYQHIYYLKRKFIKDCERKRKPEVPKTISIRKGEFLITFE